MWILGYDEKGTSSYWKVPRALDYVVIKRFEFEVVAFDNAHKIGQQCSDDSTCDSGRGVGPCRTYCCASAHVPDGILCGNDGLPYEPLELLDGWNISESLAASNETVYDVNNQYNLVGMPLGFADSYLNRDGSQVSYRLAWAFVNGSQLTIPEPIGTTAAETSFGTVDVNSEDGSATFLPAQTGLFVVYIIAKDNGGFASSVGLSEELDEVLVAEHSFEVVDIVGSQCQADTGCGSEDILCRINCCAPTTFQACVACGSDGSCYQPLGLQNASSLTHTALSNRYNRGDPIYVPGPSGFDLSLVIGAKSDGGGRRSRRQAPAGRNVRFLIAWGDQSMTGIGTSPPLGLFESGDGKDPGRVSVDKDTGGVSMIPQHNGNFTLWLLLEDESGSAASNGLPQELDQVVVSRTTFAVTGKPEFKVLSYERITRGLASDDYVVEKSATLECYVGTTYRIAPINTTTLQTIDAAEPQDQIRYTIKNTPKGFFIDPQTGEIQGNPQESTYAEYGGVRVSALWAVDASGGEAFLERIRFQVKDALLFKPVFKRERISNVVGAVDPMDLANKFFMGVSYRIAPFELDAALSVVSAGEVSDIRYTLSSKAPPSFFVSAVTGVLYGEFLTAKVFEFELLAVDKGGYQTTVEEFIFNVTERPIFGIAPAWNPKSTAPNIQAQYAVDDSYVIPKPSVEKAELFVNVAGGDASTVTYALRIFNAQDSATDARGQTELCPGPQCPGKYFVAQSGEMSITSQFVGDFVARLDAQDSSGASVTVREWQFGALPEDTLDDNNGPGGSGCGLGEMVDDVLFDQKFRCDCNKTTNLGANCDVSPPEVAPSAVDNTLTYYVGAGLGGLVVLLVIVSAVLRYRAFKISMRAFNFEEELERMRESGEFVGEISSLPRELKRSHISMIDKVGEGAFGEVWKGLLDESSMGGVPGYLVAIKSTKEAKGEGAEDLLREATVMAQVSAHVNLVSLIGVCTSGAPLLLTIAFCEHGSLVSHLKSKPKTIDSTERVRFCLEIARGMKHLFDHHFVHRDLAARNVLLDSLLTCKVADFGLSRATAVGSGTDSSESSEYYRSQSGTFPVRWTSPESMQTMKFTTESDVWSYGIVLLEIFEEGKKPYGSMGNSEVINKVVAGYRPPRPALCGEMVYSIMLRCWAEDPEDRPTFEGLVGEFDAMLDRSEFDAMPIEQSSTGESGPEESGASDGVLDALNSYAARSGSVRSGSVRSNAAQPTAAQSSTARSNPVPVVVGDRVSVNGYGCDGTVRYSGPHLNDATKGFRMLVELDEPVGKNNGTIKGTRFCAKLPPKTGVLVLPSKVTKVQPVAIRSGRSSIAETNIDDYVDMGQNAGDLYLNMDQELDDNNEYLSVGQDSGGAGGSGGDVDQDDYLSVSHDQSKAAAGSGGVDVDQDDYLSVIQQQSGSDGDSESDGFDC